MTDFSDLHPWTGFERENRYQEIKGDAQAIVSFFDAAYRLQLGLYSFDFDQLFLSESDWLKKREN